jgi:hypothetical protein
VIIIQWLDWRMLQPRKALVWTLEDDQSAIHGEAEEKHADLGPERVWRRILLSLRVGG